MQASVNQALFRLFSITVRFASVPKVKKRHIYSILWQIRRKQIAIINNAIEDFKNGKDRAVGFLVGQIMKQTKGKANPGVVNQLLQQELAKY